jgi:hypothetical protein
MHTACTRHAIANAPVPLTCCSAPPPPPAPPVAREASHSCRKLPSLVLPGTICWPAASAALWTARSCSSALQYSTCVWREACAGVSSHRRQPPATTPSLPLSALTWYAPSSCCRAGSSTSASMWSPTGGTDSGAAATGPAPPFAACCSMRGRLGVGSSVVMSASPAVMCTLTLCL